MGSAPSAARGAQETGRARGCAILAGLALQLLAFAAPAHGQPLFRAPSSQLDVGGWPTAVAVSDLDRDGRADLAVSNYMWSFSVMLGNGDGTFRAGTAYGTRGSGRVVIADLNGDEHADAVTTNADTVLVHLGNGDGTFGPAASFGTTGHPASVAIADLDGDGNVDLVTAYGAVSVLMGNGDGTFRARTDFEAWSATSVAIADVSGDGLLDAIATNGSNEPGLDPPYSDAVWVLLGNGDGTFGAPAGFGAGFYPYSVQVADFDADGRLDVAFANSEDYSRSASVLMGNGDGTFGSQRELTTGTTPTWVATGELDGDGLPDLAVASYGADPDADSNTISVHLSNGDRTFRRMPELYAGDPTSVAIADFDGDGRSDIVALGGVLSVFLGNGDGTFGTPESRTGGSPFSVAIGDLDRDGRQDLAVANGSSNSVSVLLGNGDGTFLVSSDFATGAYAKSVAIGDLDADESPDLVVANQGSNSVSVLLGNGDGSFAARTDFTTGNRPGAVAIADLDEDGRQDVAVANDGSNTVSVFHGNGDGALTHRTDLVTGGRPNWISIADLDEDGHLDLVVAAYHPFWVTVFLGNGDGTFAAGADFSVGRGTLSVSIADFDTDGRLDLAVGHFDTPDGRTVTVLLGNGDGTFRAGPDLVAGNDPYSIVAADFNADGRQDIAVPNDDLAGTVSVMLGNGDGTFSPRIRFGVGNHPLSISTADLNGDGRPDLAVANTASHSISVLLATEDGATPALMSLAAAEATPGRVILRWWGAGAAALGASVYRRADAGDWARLGGAIAEGSDLVRYEDRAVVPGERYAYRLGWQEGAAQAFSPETWVDVPAGVRLALEGFRPNPAPGAPALAFTLGDAAPATLEVLDVAGRRVLRRDVGALGAGSHVLRLEGLSRLAPGAYVVRLRQAGRTLSTRGVVVR